MKKRSIAIDGPAGAGKSTMAKNIAERLNILYLDTGAMYRTVALGVQQAGGDPWDREQVLHILGSLLMNIIYVEGQQRMYLSDNDVTAAIRDPGITKAASAIAVIPEVRMKLVEMQRDMAEKNSLVIDGRDIGTFVLPNADIKFYLVATLAERARRRHDEMSKTGGSQTLQSVVEDIRLRDQNDSNRDLAPLSMAENAILIDTTNKTIEQVVDEMYAHIEAVLP